VGIGVGAAVGLGFLILVGGFAFFVNQRRKRRRTQGAALGSTKNAAPSRQATVNEWDGHSGYKLQPILNKLDLNDPQNQQRVKWPAPEDLSG
jgi:hypothetical protein